MWPLIFISLLLIFRSGISTNKINENDVVESPSAIVEKTIEPSPSSDTKKEAKVEGAKIEVKVETNSTSRATTSPSSNIDNFKYPNAKLVSGSSGSMTLESTDNTAKITDWYKAKISEKDMNVKTFVTTTTNDRIENKLVGANGEEKIEIEITGTTGQVLTIKINLTTN